MRVTGALWALDSSLAHRRHYPAVNWHRSYSLHFERLSGWYVKNVDPGWPDLRAKLVELLKKEAELQEVVQLVGPDALQPGDRLLLEVSRLLHDGFLQQSALSERDASCSLERQAAMLRLFLAFYARAEEALDSGAALAKILSLPIREELSRLREEAPREGGAWEKDLSARLEEAFEHISDS
jgi:V/A-type H+-transporting ATPase subunit A